MEFFTLNSQQVTLPVEVIILNALEATSKLSIYGKFTRQSSGF